MTCARCNTQPCGYGKTGRHCLPCAQAITHRPWKVAR